MITDVEISNFVQPIIFPSFLSVFGRSYFKIQGTSSSVHHTSYSLIPAPKRRRLLYYNWNSIVHTMSKCSSSNVWMNVLVVVYLP